MRKILLLAGITAFSSATAQQKDVFNIDKHIQKILEERKKTADMEKLLPLLNNKTQKAPLQSLTLPNGDKVVTYPGYNMPCIVPDMRQFQAMPNVANTIIPGHSFILQQNRPGVIPNAALPFKIIY